MGEEHLPPWFVRSLEKFQWDHGTFKIDWALSGAIPWRAEAAARAGTVHLCDSMDRITAYASDLARGHIPAHPFVLLGQMNKADPTRSPPGTETVWAYTHVPNTARGDAARRAQRLSGPIATPRHSPTGWKPWWRSTRPVSAR